VLAATKAAGIFFLNSVTEDDVEAMIDEGVRIGAASREAAEGTKTYRPPDAMVRHGGGILFFPSALSACD
jgi:hypothetical protein